MAGIFPYSEGGALLAMFLASLLCAGSVVAAPGEKGGYAGGAIGFGRHHVDNGPLVSGLSTEKDFELESANGWALQLYGGYHFRPRWAIEARYTYFGDYSSAFTLVDKGEEDEEVERGEGEISADFSVASLHALGVMPIFESGFDIFAQFGVGMVWWDLAVEDTARHKRHSQSSSDWALALGLGFNYTHPSLTAMTARLFFDAYLFDLDLEFESASKRVFSTLFMVGLGFQYNF
jgi:opacity protein-like surface antigen